MTQTAEKILSDAMKLDEAERFEIAAKLMDAADSEADADYSEAWAAEIGERLRQLDSGEAHTVPLEQAMKIIRSDGKCIETG